MNTKFKHGILQWLLYISVKAELKMGVGYNKTEQQI